MQLWNVTLQNAEVRVSCSSKVSPGWNKRAWGSGRLVVIEVVVGMVVVVEPLYGFLMKGRSREANYGLVVK